MAENKYFWLKLKDDFFQQKEIKKLRKIAGGDTYTIIYLKFQLLSLKTDGTLIFEGIEENIIEELALELDEEVENIRMTWLYLEKHGMIEQISNEQFMLPKTIESIGSETSVAARVRKFREKQKALQCNTIETNGNVHEIISNTEIEKEIEIEKDIEIEKNKKQLAIDKEVNSKVNGKANVSEAEEDIDKEKDIAKKTKNKNKNKTIKELIDGYSNNQELRQALFDFNDMRNQIKKPLTDRALKMIFKKLNDIAVSGTDGEKIKILDESILHSWSDIYALKNNQYKQKEAVSIYPDL